MGATVNSEVTNKNTHVKIWGKKVALNGPWKGQLFRELKLDGSVTWLDYSWECVRQVTQIFCGFVQVHKSTTSMCQF